VRERGVRSVNMEDKAQRIVRCPHCGAKNRVPADKSVFSAKCGKCHKSLEAGKEKTDGEPILLRCSECRSKNRVRTDHLEDQAKCGKCGALLRTKELFEPQPIAISDGNFEEKVLKSPLPVLVFAMSPTCPTCNLTAPHVDAFARESKGKALVGKLNVQFNPQLASRFDILSVPQFLIFDRGELIETLTGALDTGQFMMKMAKYLY
jgi:thioredoxin 2